MALLASVTGQSDLYIVLLSSVDVSGVSGCNQMA